MATHNQAGGSEAPRCPDCGESVAARDCEPCVLATPSPMAGGAPTPADEPAGPGATLAAELGRGYWTGVVGHERCAQAA
jgi:hypothetical protein